MTEIAPASRLSPAAASAAYSRVASGESGFAASLSAALEEAVHAGREADRQAQGALHGAGSIAEVSLAIARAELTLQTAAAIRDRVVQAYQDILRMPI
jgi:flagellar hook-basal body complex protein FliE